MLTWREVWTYVRLVIRWWWVLAISVTLASGVAFFFARQQPTYYETRVVLMIGDSLTASSPDPVSIGLNTTLASFYGELARREPILKPVTERLGLTFPWQVIANAMISTSVNQRANLLEISVTDSNPVRAAAIANAISDELIRFSPTSPEKIAEQQAVFVKQLREAESELEQVEQKIKGLQDRQATLQSAVDIRDNEDQIAQLEKVRERAQNTYKQLVALQNSSTFNTLRVFEAAPVPNFALPNKRNLTVAMAGGGGLLLGLLAILLLELFDERWRDGRDLRARFGLADLGTLPLGAPIVASPPHQAAQREQAVREAHTRILLAALVHGTRTLLVTSPEPNEARSAFTVDLAMLFTRSGYRVLLVDADMTAPHLTNLIGQSTYTNKPVVIHNGDVKMWSHLQPTAMENVMLLARHLGEDGRPLAPSLPWPELVQSLYRAADIIIFDGPSTLSGADAALLAPLVDGIVLALDPKRDMRRAILECKARLQRRREANLLGAVVVQHDYRSHNRRLTPPLLGDRLPQLTRLLTSGNTSGRSGAAATPAAAFSSPTGLATTTKPTATSTEEEANTDAEAAQPKTHQPSAPLVTPPPANGEPPKDAPATEFPNQQRGLEGAALQ